MLVHCCTIYHNKKMILLIMIAFKYMQLALSKMPLTPNLVIFFQGLHCHKIRNWSTNLCHVTNKTYKYHLYLNKKIVPSHYHVLLNHKSPSITITLYLRQIVINFYRKSFCLIWWPYRTRQRTQISLAKMTMKKFKIFFRIVLN